MTDRPSLRTLPPTSRPRRRLIAVGRIALAATVIAGVVWLLDREFRGFDWPAVWATLAELPASRVWIALGLVAANYAVLGLYDRLGLRYARVRVPVRRSALASFAGYAASITLGNAVLTGGAVRYRLYGKWGVSDEAVARVVVFTGLSFWVGFTLLAGVVLLVDPVSGGPDFPVSPRVLGVAFVSVFMVWLGVNIAAPPPLTLGRVRVNVPGWRLTLGQAAVAMADLLLSAGILWVLLPPAAAVSFGLLLAAYLLALVAGMLSLVPGGLGVFEGLMVLMLVPAIEPTAIVATLVAYRAMYSLLPFGLAAGAFGAVEARRVWRGRRAAQVRAARARRTFLPRAAQSSR